jgi:hypothetical protein
MESSNVSPAPHCAAVARRRLAGAVALCLIAVGGCDRGASSAPAPVAPPTPAEHLASVMKRLEYAVAHAKPAASSGVASTRSCAYRLIEPADDDARPAAEVVIETRVSYTPRADAAPQPIGETVASPDNKPIRQVETRTFKLEYDGQRWELVEPPQDELTESEQLFFQYALSDG